MLSGSEASGAANRQDSALRCFAAAQHDTSSANVSHFLRSRGRGFLRAFGQRRLVAFLVPEGMVYCMSHCVADSMAQLDTGEQAFLVTV